MNRRRTKQEVRNDSLADARIALSNAAEQDRDLWQVVIDRLIARGAKDGGTPWADRK